MIFSGSHSGFGFHPGGGVNLLAVPRDADADVDGCGGGDDGGCEAVVAAG